METTTTKTTKVKVRIVEREGGSDGSSGSWESSGGGSGRGGSGGGGGGSGRGGGGGGGGSGGGGGGEERGIYVYSGWVYHLGTNSIGRQYCHLRFLFIKGKYVQMYKRDPQDHPGIVCFLLCLPFFFIVFCCLLFWLKDQESKRCFFCV
jgi:hypothetical protein